MSLEAHRICILLLCIAGMASSGPLQADDVVSPRPSEEAADALSAEVIGYLQMGDHEKAWASLQRTRGPAGVGAFVAGVMSHAPLETRRSWIGEVSPVLPWVPGHCASEARVFLDLDQREKAMEAAQWGLRGTLPESAIAEELHALLEDARLRQPIHMERLGVLLPLSGRFKALGQSMLAALKTALDQGGEVDIVVRDTRGDAGRARVLAEELMDAHGVGAVLGPIGRQEAASAAEVLARSSVPHVLLSRHGGSEAPGDCRILFRLSRAAEVHALVQVAVERRGVKRFGILREDSVHGAAMSDAFRSAVQQGGGAVVADILLPKRGEFPGIAEMKGLEALKGAKGAPSVDALFLPVSARMAHRILPHLRARGIRFSRDSDEGVLLLGSSRWDSPDIVDKAEATTRGGLYPTGFSPRPGDGPSSRFQRMFKGLHGDEPRAVDAEIYDATRLALEGLAVAQREKTGRRGACEWMRKGDSFEGATGLVRVLSSGRVSRVVVIRQVHESGTRAIADVRVAGDKAVVEAIHDAP